MECKLRGVVRWVCEVQLNHWLERRGFFQWCCRNPCRLRALLWVGVRRKSDVHGMRLPLVEVLCNHAACYEGKEATDGFGAFDKLIGGRG